MNANINPTTGIAYGYISASVLDPEVVECLMTEGKDLTFEEYRKNLDPKSIAEAWGVTFYQSENGSHWTWIERDAKEFGGKFDTLGDAVLDIADRYGDDLPQSMIDGYQPEEPEVEGTYEGVSYRASWLGGALNFFIFESPLVTSSARRASPCVPNCGILDTLDGDVRSYDVPRQWRWG